MTETKIRKDIEVRVIPEKGYYSGYLYNNQLELKETDEYILLNVELESGWNRVTDTCFTRKGCKRSVLSWIKCHTIEEYKIKLEK